jgi:outer membrane protein TolC
MWTMIQDFKICLLGGCLLIGVQLNAQEKQLTLEEAFALAERQSLDAFIAQDVLLNSFWRYRSYKAELLPNVILEGTFPSFNRSLSLYQKENGSYGFVKNNTLTEELSLSVRQNIPFTGGTLTLQTYLQRMDQLDDKLTSYLNIPFSIVLQQPLFHAKSLKWATRTEPERYREARKQYQVNMEAVYLNVINYYFDLLLAKVNLDIANVNLDNAVKLHDVAQGKRELGLISRNQMYQLELGKINAEAEIISVRQAYDNKMLTLRNYLRMEDDEVILPVTPRGFRHLDITLEQVMALAHENHPVTHQFTRALMEAHMRIDQAKTNRGFKADLYLSIGNTGSDVTLATSYRNLQNREMISLGIRIPVIDWGKGRGGVKLAKSEQQVVEWQVEQARLNFEQSIVLSVTQFRSQGHMVNLAHHADSVAQLRYETAFQTFVMGTINVLDINSAQVERDNARRRYINELYLSWLFRAGKDHLA